MKKLLCVLSRRQVPGEQPAWWDAQGTALDWAGRANGGTWGSTADMAEMGGCLEQKYKGQTRGPRGQGRGTRLSVP